MSDDDDEPVMDRSFLAKLEGAYDAYENHREALLYRALRLAGHPWDDSDPSVKPEHPWPFESVTWDSYDSSFETKRTRDDWVPSEEFFAGMWALGFVKCWICYADGTELQAGARGYRGERMHKWYTGECNCGARWDRVSYAEHEAHAKQPGNHGGAGRVWKLTHAEHEAWRHARVWPSRFEAEVSGRPLYPGQT